MSHKQYGDKTANIKFKNRTQVKKTQEWMKRQITSLKPLRIFLPYHL